MSAKKYDSAMPSAKVKGDKGNKTVIEQYYNLVKNIDKTAISEVPHNAYADTPTVTGKRHPKHRMINSISSQANALQTISPRNNDLMILRKDIGFASPQQSLNQRVGSSYLQNRYNKSGPYDTFQPREGAKFG